MTVGEQADLYMDEVGTDVYVRRSLALTTANMFKIRFNDEWKDEKVTACLKGDRGWAFAA